MWEFYHVFSVNTKDSSTLKVRPPISEWRILSSTWIVCFKENGHISSNITLPNGARFLPHVNPPPIVTWQIRLMFSLTNLKWLSFFCGPEETRGGWTGCCSHMDNMGKIICFTSIKACKHFKFKWMTIRISGPANQVSRKVVGSIKTPMFTMYCVCMLTFSN